MAKCKSGLTWKVVPPYGFESNGTRHVHNDLLAVTKQVEELFGGGENVDPSKPATPTRDPATGKLISKRPSKPRGFWSHPEVVAALTKYIEQIQNQPKHLWKAVAQEFADSVNAVAERLGSQSRTGPDVGGSLRITLRASRAQAGQIHTPC